MWSLRSSSSCPSRARWVSGLLRDVERAVTVIMAAVVGLTFLFGFVNKTLALRLGVPVWVAPLGARLSGKGLLMRLASLGGGDTIRCMVPRCQA